MFLIFLIFFWNAGRIVKACGVDTHTQSKGAKNAQMGRKKKRKRKKKTTHAGGDAAEDGGRNNHRLEHVGLRRHRNAVVHHLVHELPTASNHGQEEKGKKEKEKKKTHSGESGSSRVHQLVHECVCELALPTQDKRGHNKRYTTLVRLYVRTV